MYAIVEINGQQFKAEAGKKLFVHHMQNAEAGATVEFEKVLLVDKDGNITVGAPTVEGAKVVCEVVSALVKGDKVLVFHKKRRKGYRKLNGHSQQFKAEAGKKLFVHHIQNAENGATVEFDKVLLVDKDGNITVGAPTVEGAKVVCQVVSNMVKGDKVLVFHKKRRKGYRKLNGHRQQFTELTITEVVA